MVRNGQSRTYQGVEADGWYEVNQIGSHKQFKDPTKKGPRDGPVPKRDIPLGTPEEH
jgi:predicted RNA binding protein YcfA (HicA-like mRNA interferase family)